MYSVIRFLFVMSSLYEHIALADSSFALISSALEVCTSFILL